MFIEMRYSRFQKLRRSEMFFLDNKSVLSGKTQHATPTEFKNFDNLICYKHFTPSGVRQKRFSNRSASMPACKIQVLHPASLKFSMVLGTIKFQRGCRKLSRVLRLIR